MCPHLKRSQSKSVSGWTDGKWPIDEHSVILYRIFSFDMVHFGHANALRQAKLMGDVLVAGVHSDG